MAVKKNITYSIKFTSKTDSRDVSYHGSPEWGYFQTIGKEDEEIRCKLLQVFALTEQGNIFHGSDGEFNYTFGFFDRMKEIENEPKKNVEYETFVKISKSGKEEKLEQLSDIESFLVNNGFKRVNPK